MNEARRVFLITAFDALFVFGLIVFSYVVGISYFQPYWLNKEAFHLQVGIWWLSGLRNDNMGVIALVVSFVGFFCSRYLRNQRSAEVTRVEAEKKPTESTPSAELRLLG